MGAESEEMRKSSVNADCKPIDRVPEAVEDDIVKACDMAIFGCRSRRMKKCSGEREVAERVES